MRARIFGLLHNAYAHIFVCMNPMQHIRLHVLKISQAEMAEVTGRDQATVSRWERGALEPSRDDMDKIRAYARSKRVRWNDRLFFEIPSAPAEGRAA
ncbi:helix-turn-helix domain-containing protein [Azospirillum argentinense]